jgi:hypothetical protein
MHADFFKPELLSERFEHSRLPVRPLPNDHCMPHANLAQRYDTPSQVCG